MKATCVLMVLLTASLGVRPSSVVAAEADVVGGAASAGESPLENLTAPGFASSSDFPMDLRHGWTAEGVRERPGSFYSVLGVGMFAVAGADLASTELGWSRPGVFEVNPLQRNRGVRVATHVAAPALMYWVTDRLHRSGRPKLALMARLGFNVAYSYVVMHNLRSGGAP
jgi:hypothetical protein